MNDLVAISPAGGGGSASRLSDRPMVLVVDDTASNIHILYEILREDYEVCVASSGRQALEFCDSRLPDLILLDVIMAEMGGYEVCRRLKSGELTKDIPVIFVTSQNDPQEEASGLDQGAVDFISKPVHAKVVLARVRTHLTLRRQNEILRSLALIDGLTGVANRRQFDNVLTGEWRRCARTQRPLSLFMIDIDFFKRYNDHYGHQAGDECIKSIAATLKACLQRSFDIVARYGGEEFACILPDTPADGAYVKATELEMAVRALAIPHEKSEIAPVTTISVGVAVAQPTIQDQPQRLIAEADAQLYAAKHAGRGQVKIFSMP